MVSRKIANTAIGRDVGDALSAYPVSVLIASITQRVVFAESAAQGKAVHEIDAGGSAARGTKIADEVRELLIQKYGNKIL